MGAIKQKCSLFLFWIFCYSSVIDVHAQKDTDTTFSFYFNSSQYKIDTAQQKGFETFLNSITHIKSIHSFADTSGSSKYNLNLTNQRAAKVHQLLLEAFQSSPVTARGETDSLPQLWQNRRVDVLAVKKTERFITNDIYLKGTVKKELNPDHILFLPDQPVLTEASYGYVEELAQQLQLYTTEKFQIIGHVNYQSKLPADKLKDLYDLSEARAKTVYDLLVQYGIDAGRMTYKGVGNADPVFPEPVNEEQKRKNMRVQVLILR